MIVEGKLAPGTFSSLTMVDITPRMEEAGVDQVLGFMAQNMDEGFATLDEAAAVSWYRRARQRGSEEAEAKLDRLLARRPDLR